MVLCIVVETSSCITWSDGKKKWLELSCEKVADQNIVAYLFQTIMLMRAVAHAQLPCPSRCFSGLFASLSWHCVLLVLSYSVCWCWALGRFCMIFVVCIGLSLSVSSLLLSAWSRVFPFMESAISAPHVSICFLCLCRASSLLVCCLSVGVHLVFTDSLCRAVLFSCMIVHARLLPCTTFALTSFWTRSRSCCPFNVHHFLVDSKCAHLRVIGFWFAKVSVFLFLFVHHGFCVHVFQCVRMRIAHTILQL